MNNEEKILQMLEGLTRDMSEMKRDMAEVKTRLTKVEDDTKATRTLVETEVFRWFQLLAEDASIVREQMATHDDIEDLHDALDVRDAVIKSHAREIRVLKNAK